MVAAAQLSLPTIIQGGMGVGISNWRLARAVSQLGQLGVVSGTGISRVLACRLMDGDAGGHMRRALATFPLQEPVQAILAKYFISGGKPEGAPYRSQPVYAVKPPRAIERLTVVANFVEVALAKEGHPGVVGINLLEKIQLPNLASLYGAMLAGVDYVLMGAGIPIQVPAILDKLARHEPVSYRLEAEGLESGQELRIHFDPERVFPGIGAIVGELKRPRFLPIVSSHVLAQAMLSRSEGSVEGFVVEGSTAGGHNAPPRGAMTLSPEGEPVYGERDRVDLEKLKHLGLPFWLAGGYGRPGRLADALATGAAGVQVGTAFALCEESGMEPALKARLLELVREGKVQVRTSPLASPTGYPIKVAMVPGTASDPEVYARRARICDFGFLRTITVGPDGQVGYRCPSEPVEDTVRKGGLAEDTVGRVCLCSSLLATAGHAQVRKDGSVEPQLVTAGDDLVVVAQFLAPGKTSYTAQEVVARLLSALPEPSPV